MLLALIYFYSFAFLSYIARDSIKIPEKRVRFETIGCFILLFGFMGFRDLPVLNDTAHYYEHFEDVLSGGDVSLSNIFRYDIYDRFSIGYQIYERFIGAVFGHPYMIICVSALITTISFLYFAKLHTEKVALLIFMCLTTFMMDIYSGIRQGLATCIFLFALIFLERERTLVYYALVFLAYLFHPSAIILFILPVLQRIPFNKMAILLTVVATLAAIIGIDYLVRITGLNEMDYFDYNKERETLPIGSMLNSMVLLFFVVTAYKIKVSASIKDNATISLFWWIALLDLFFSVLDSQFPILARFCMYFNTVTFTLVLYYFSQIKSLKTRRMIYTLVVCFLMLRIGAVLVYRPEWYHFDPTAFYDFSIKVHNTRFGY